MHMYLSRAKEVSGSSYPNWKVVVCWCEKQIGYKLLIVEKIIFFLGIQWNWAITFSFAQVTILHFNWFIDEKLRKRASKHLGNSEAHFFAHNWDPLSLQHCCRWECWTATIFCLKMFLYNKFTAGYFHNNVKINNNKASTMYFYDVESLQYCLSINRISLFIHNLFCRRDT